MATAQSNYSKWYYENYVKKGLTIGRKKKAVAFRNKVNQRRSKALASAAKQKKASASGASNNTLSITRLNDDAKAEIKAYKKQLDQQGKAQRQKLDNEFKAMQEQKKADIDQIRATVKQTREERDTAKAEHKEAMTKKMDELAAKIRAMTPYERGLQREQLIAEINALKAENEKGKQAIKDKYAKATSASKAETRKTRQDYAKAKERNRKERKKIATQISAKYKKRLKSMLKKKHNRRKRRKRR